MNCKYKIKNTDYIDISYEELYEYVLNKTKDKPDLFETIQDIVFSRTIDTDALLNKVDELRKNSRLTERRRSEMDGVTEFRPMFDPDSVYEAPGMKVLSLQQLVDMGDIYKNSDGKRYVTPLNVEDYKKELIQKKFDKKKLSMSEADAMSEAEMEVESTILHWKQIEQDGNIVHRLSSIPEVWSGRSEFWSFKTKLDNLYKELGKDSPFISDSVEKQLYDNFKLTYNHHIAGRHPRTKFRSNINLQEFIPEYQFELVGHIDYLGIGEDGAVHVYNYKVSGTNPAEWSQAKEEKYKHELALLKWIIQKKLGVNPNKITMSLIPIELKYDETGEKITGVNIYGDEVKQYELKNGSYTFLHYDNAAKSILKPSPVIPIVTDQVLLRADQACNIIFPDLGITSEGITRSAEEWAKLASPHNDFIKIKKVDEIGHAYDVTINGVTYAIANPKPQSKNEEIIQLIKDHLKELNDNKGRITQALSDAINKGYEHGFNGAFDVIPGFDHDGANYLNRLFSIYTRKDANDEYKWERLAKNDSRLIGAGIFLFKNKVTGQIDVITVSPHALLARKEFRYKQKNLLGAYKMDTEVNMLQGDYGNLEVIRSMILLNELLPEIELNDGKLGDIKVISPQERGKARIYDMEHIVKNYMPQIYKVMREKGNGFEVRNNYRGISYIDPVESALAMYDDLTKDISETSRNTLDTELKPLREASTKEDKLIAIQNVLQYLTGNTGTDGLKLIAEQATFSGYDLRSKLIAELSKAYLYYSGEHLRYAGKGEWSSFTNFYGNLKVPNYNIRLVMNNYIKAIDIISEETESYYDQHLRQPIMKFYEEMGYTSAENEILGDQLRVYKNLYETDENGKNMLIFKNPYSHKNDPTYLNDAERRFLKRALFLFAKQRYSNFSATSENDEEYITTFISNLKASDTDYFWVPLKKASAASSRQKFSTIGSKARTLGKSIIKGDLQGVFQQLEQDLDSNESEQIESGLSSLVLSNPFQIGDNPRTRQNYIDNHDPDYFETNVETLLIDYTYHNIATDRLNEMLVGTKAILLSVDLLGRESNNTEITSKELDYMIDYIKRNIFNQSIMSKRSQQIIGVLSPVRTFVTYSNLAGNLVSAYRDMFNGFLENYARTVNHFQTDLSAANVSRAYQYVFTHAMTSSMAVSLLSKLCVKYRLSNIDVARITEGLNSNTGGAVRFDNWAFSTLRKPDFVNRMVLFVARCMQDGTWDAFSMDNDTLVYDWKKDKRFSLLTKDVNTLSDEDKKQYYIQRKLYREQVAAYNTDHPNATISDDYTNPDEPGLPEPYSKEQILTIRDVANNIYGAYDTGLKNMLEHHSYGWAFAMYSTWMGGIWNNMFTKTDSYNTAQKVREQEIDEDGNLLYIDKDGNITTDSNNGKNEAIMKDVPMIVQGVAYTMKDLFNIIKDDGFAATKEYINGNEMVKQNLRKFIGDMLLFALLQTLFALVFSPKYKEYKKDMDKNPIVTNLLVEILYKSSSRSFDSFGGPINIIEFVGENTNPPIYQVPVKLLQDTWRWRLGFGEKSFGQVVTGNFAIARAYRDTYNAYRKANE